jgi:hypothetical protein
MLGGTGRSWREARTGRDVVEGSRRFGRAQEAPQGQSERNWRVLRGSGDDSPPPSAHGAPRERGGAAPAPGREVAPIEHGAPPPAPQNDGGGRNAAPPSHSAPPAPAASPGSGGGRGGFSGGGRGGFGGGR